MNKYYQNIHTDKNYKNMRDGRVFTGQQTLNLLEVAEENIPVLVAIILLEIQETDEPATQPQSKYGTDQP
jgi:hypothetical protein